MRIFVFILLSTNLALFIYEDFKYRAISWWGLISLFVLSSLYSSLYATFNEILHNSLFIFLFLICQYILVKLFYVVKSRGNVSIINRKIGNGDILFLLAIMPLFSPLQFIYIYIIGLIFTLSAHWVIRDTGKKSVPLAGFFSIYLIVVLVFSQIAKYVLCNDEKILFFLYSNN